MKFLLSFLKGEKNWRILIYGLIIVSAMFLLTIQAIAGPISEEARWWVTIGITVFIGLAAIAAAIYGTRILKGALDGAFRRTESVIEGGFSQTHSKLNTVEETTVITALGSKEDRPSWNNFLQDTVEEAVEKHYLRITAENPVTTSSAEELLPVNIQREIQGVVGENPDIPFEELAAKVVEKLHVRRLASLARTHRISLNEIIAVVAGFAGRIGAKE